MFVRTYLRVIAVFLVSLVVGFFSYAVQEATVLHFDAMEDISRWQALGPGVKVESEKSIVSEGSGAMKLTLTSTKEKGERAVVCRIPLTIKKNTVVEFDYYPPVSGSLAPIFEARPADVFQEIQMPGYLRPGEWQRVRLPLLPKSGESASLEELRFHFGTSAPSGEKEIISYIDNFQILSFPAHFEKTQTTLIDASTLPLDKRLEVEIPNLLVNGYFRELGDRLPPRGWMDAQVDKMSYVSGRHDGRAIRFNGSDNVVYLRQFGLVLVPGEPYKISGYIRGEQFSGAGGIGVICNNWSKFWGFRFSAKDVKPDWHYFEGVFSPGIGVAKGDYEVVIYRSKGTGTLDVDRVILEPLSRKGLMGSKNKLSDNKFDELYAEALKKGELKSGPPSDDYQLVWSDEFDGVSVDTDKWKVYDLDVYRESRGYILTPRSVSLNGKGQLLLTIRKTDGIYEYPRLATVGKFETTYGYFECRAKMPNVDKANGAFWMLPAGRMDARDPINTGMEIDIFECVTPSAEKLSHTTHWYSIVEGKRLSYSGGTVAHNVPGLSKRFHTIGFEWTPTDYIFYINGIESYRCNKKDHPITVAPHTLILSFAGGKDSEKTPVFEIDYVRVYKKK